MSVAESPSSGMGGGGGGVYKIHQKYSDTKPAPKSRLILIHMVCTFGKQSATVAGLLRMTRKKVK